MKYLIPTLIVTSVSIGAAAISSAASEKGPCCFTNPRYSGQCKVTPGTDENCADILKYLNTQNSVGKAYCGNTTIRGGWASVTCEEKEAAMPEYRDAERPEKWLESNPRRNHWVQ